jgi:tRNA threonylcarbamoyladenosine biosynthesis protein TsaE
MDTNIFAELRSGSTASSAEEMRSLAEALARALPEDATLALHGDLGVGKTTFVQGLALGFGIQEPVTSPTFTIFHLYRSAAPAASMPENRRPTLLHLDAYRLENEKQVDALMLEDFLVPPFCLAVEWPERIPAWIPPTALHLELSIVADGKHRVQLRGN